MESTNCNVNARSCYKLALRIDMQRAHTAFVRKVVEELRVDVKGTVFNRFPLHWVILLDRHDLIDDLMRDGARARVLDECARAPN